MNVRTLPKVELHCHLEGCFRPDTVREVGRTLGIEVPSDPATFRRDWLITEPMQDLAVALRKFANIQSVWGSEEVIERLTAVASAAAFAVSAVPEPFSGVLLLAGAGGVAALRRRRGARSAS